MPVIKFAYTELEELLGGRMDREELIDLLPMLGSDIEEYDDEGVKVEFFPNRPDYLSLEGVTRTIKGFLGLEEGMPRYSMKESGTSITVDPKLGGIRPYVACCLVEDIKMDEEKLRQLMDFQEDLHWVLGRDRRKVAIGIHNLDVIQGPYRFMAADPDKYSFVALEMDEELTLREILEKHPKGRSYAHLVDQYNKYPLILDNDDNVLSMPPIINGELTKLTTDTRNILIDVTGTDQKAVESTLNILATSFAEAGGQIKTMEIIYPDVTVTRPDLTPQKQYLSVKNANKIIGLSLTVDEVLRALQRVRLDAEALDSDRIIVQVPAYRVDILHEVDLSENVAIGYCFRKIKPELPQVATVAHSDPYHDLDKLPREILTGLGYTEVMSLMLTNEESHYHKMGLPEEPRVEVAQPISQDRTMIRQSLLNSLLEFLENNRDQELPQKIFEVGEVVYLDPDTETGTRGVKMVAALSTHSQANFTEIKSTADSLLTNLGLQMEIGNTEHPSYIKGRCARLEGVEKDVPEAVVKGYFGELHPKVITNFNLEYPVVALELDFRR